MDTMQENGEGNMEFPRDVMYEDCFPEMQEPLYGFITNVTILNDSPCLLEVECFENGTSIKNTTNLNQDSIISDIRSSDRQWKLKHFLGMANLQDLSINLYKCLHKIEILFVLEEYLKLKCSRSTS